MQRQICAFITIAAATTPPAQPDPGSDPELTGETVIRRGEVLRAGSGDAPGVARPIEAAQSRPARPHEPETAEGEGKLLTEGTFLVDSPGLLRTTPSGAWVFVPQAGENGDTVRPLIVMPSQILGRLVRIIIEPSGAADVRLTGRVTLFRGQNYLLVTSIGDQQPSLAQPQDTGLAPDTGDELSGAVETLIDELEAERTGIRGVISGLGTGAEGVVAPVAEGRMISRRRGRFVRLDAGELAVRFDNDDAESPIDAPLVIAPCSLLGAVEETLEIHGDAMTATISGQTLAYAGRSFLLPISIVIDRPSELDTRQ